MSKNLFRKFVLGCVAILTTATLFLHAKPVTAARLAGVYGGGSPWAIPGTIQAENYDTGGEGAAYHDLEAANQGGQYRTSEGVDIEVASDTGGGYNVGWIRNGEWINYSVNVQTTGNYTLTARVATGVSTGSFRVDFGGVDKTGTVTVPSTGSWQTWGNVSRTVSLTAGQQVMRIYALGDDVNLNYVTLTLVAATATPASGQNPYPAGSPAWAIPGTIQAENYDSGGEGVAFHDQETANQGGQYRTDGVDIEATSDTGGGYNVGWIRTDEWYEYTVNVQTTGNYTLTARVASAAATGSFRVEFNGVDKTGAIAVASTGGWQTWANVTRTVSLTAGQQVMRVYALGNDLNLNYLSFTSGAATATPTNTVVVPTATPSRTNTPTNTSVAPTNTPVVPTNTPVPTATPSGSSNLALGKAISASSSIYTFLAANANDNNLTTYWEGGALPANITVSLGANANISSVVVKLDPSTAWGQRTQTIQVLGRSQSTSTYSSLVGAATYTFNPASGNTVTIPVTATVADVQLNFTSNSGAPSGQVAEFQIFGVMAPNPDLVVNSISWSPAAPNESNAITLSAVVQNIGSAASAATTLDFSVAGVAAGSANVPALNAGASATVSLNIGNKAMGTYSVAATVDPANTVFELNNANNAYTSPTSLSVVQAPGPDLQILGVSMNPQSPKAGNAVSFVVSVNNRGTTAVSAGYTTRVVIGSLTLNNANSPAVAAGTTVDVTVGTWTAVDGTTPLTATVDATGVVAETIETNNSFSKNMAVGRGAIMPYVRIEAESASVATNGTKLTPNYIIGDYAGEASGRSAVLLDATGEYVEFTLPIAANAIVVRNAIPNSADGAGIDANLSVYAGGADKGNIVVSSKYSYVYASPTTLGQLGYNNLPGGTAYWLYEEANMMLDQVYAAGTKLRLQKDSGDVQWVYVDFVEFENVAPAASNPDPARYVQVSASKTIDQALTEFRADSNKLGIFIPAGTWNLDSKIYVYGRATQIIGAGPWHTRIVAPQSSSNNDIGFNIASTANGSTIKNLSAWGNYRYRVDGPGKFIDGNGMQNVTVENIWVEHFICLYWGVNSSNNTFKDLRIRNTFADGINMTNSSSNNIITNSEARGTGDDAFAAFSAIDSGGSYNVGNQYTNLTAILVRRAAAFAIYGGSGNLFQNLYAADTLTYPGITISSLSFGYNTLGFGDQDTVFDGITLERVGGDFWTSVGADDKINDYQNFAGIWFFAGDRAFKNILVKNVDIINPVYFGVMFQTKYPEQPPMQNVRLQNVNIYNAPRYGVKLVVRAEGSSNTPPVGSVTFTNVQIINSGVAAIYGQNQSPNFTIAYSQ